MTAIENEPQGSNAEIEPHETPGDSYQPRPRALPDLDALAQRFRSDPDSLAAVLKEMLELGDREVGSRGRTDDCGP